MSPVDPFGRTDRLDDGTLAALVERFESRGRHPRFAAMLDQYLDAMGVEQAQRVLDMGCGTGLAARAIARRAGFSGTVTGIDLSPYLVEAAQRLAGEEGIAQRTEFRVADTGALDDADGSFDAIVAHTLLSHVEEPAAVLAEAVRLLRSGGVLGVFDGDYASLTFDHADPATGRACDEALVGAVVTNPRVMRQMPRLLHRVGLELIASFPHVLSEIGHAEFWASAIEAYRRLIPQAGTMTADEADAWAAGLRRDSESGFFFGSSNYYAYVARKP